MKHQSTSPDLEVAKRLKFIRKSKGLSQRKLSKLVNVGSGTISLIESGSTQSSVSLLKKILGGMDVNLGFFFSFELKDDQKIFFSKNELKELGAHGVSYLLVAGERKDRKLQMLQEVYSPGSDSGRTDLSHDGEECAVVIEGHLEVSVNGQSRLLGPGDAYYFESRLPHRFRKPGDVICCVVSACTPASF